jgi:hypothetical protein
MPHWPQQLGIDSGQPGQRPRIVSVIFSIALAELALKTKAKIAR